MNITAGMVIESSRGRDRYVKLVTDYYNNGKKCRKVKNKK